MKKKNKKLQVLFKSLIEKFLETASRSCCGIGVSRGAYELISVYDSHRRYKGYTYKDFKNFRIDEHRKKCELKNAYWSRFEKIAYVFFDHKLWSKTNIKLNRYKKN